MTMLNLVRDFLSDIVCPRCLEPLKNWKNAPQPFHCQNCRCIIPLSYLREVKKTPPIFVQLFGLTGVGKTMFLDMLRLQLYDMANLWSRAFASPITQLDMDHREILLTERRHGTLASSTASRSRDQNEVYIMQLKNMDRWNSHFLVLMDFSGEQFNTLEIAAEDIPFLCRIPVTIMLLSMPDMNRQDKTVESLMDSYITTLKNNGVNFSRTQRHLIIVFNKADLIRNLPPEINDYLQRDQIYTLLKKNKPVDMSGEHLSAYLAEMAYISDKLANWVWNSVPGGRGMLHRLQENNISARFTIMSATGHELTNNGTGFEPVPRRVLDPFFWLMEAHVRQ
ncbi:MAG TPA: hypothetical protein VNG51_20750 [Ktedonobacteraceae bacterium]|nr:hypothetical protein [Ktedonobacteraceae bacterium]